jgi:hypothetical protein
MNFFEYSQLDKDCQAQTVWKCGKHINTRYSSIYAILLWQLERFYVEIHYDRIDDKIESIRCFLSMEPITPYLK